MHTTWGFVLVLLLAVCLAPCATSQAYVANFTQSSGQWLTVPWDLGSSRNLTLEAWVRPQVGAFTKEVFGAPSNGNVWLRVGADTSVVGAASCDVTLPFYRVDTSLWTHVAVVSAATKGK